jgi:hypothetical protein
MLHKLVVKSLRIRYVHIHNEYRYEFVNKISTPLYEWIRYEFGATGNEFLAISLATH